MPGIRRRELLIASAAMLLPRLPARAANHRGAPLTANQVATNIADMYMFRAPNDQKSLVMVMNTHPFSVPDEAASYHYEPAALYRFNFSTLKSAELTSEIDFVFSPFADGTQTFTAFFPDGTTVQGPVTQGTVTSNSPNHPIITKGPKGIQIFAGPRADPFFFDFVGFERFLAGTGGFTGTNSFANVNVNSIVVQFPIDLAVGKAKKFGAWASTFTALEPPAGPPFVGLSQADRFGNPAVKTVFIPAALKDAYSQALPQNDPLDFGPTIINSLSSLGTNADNSAIIESVVIPDTMKLDLAQPDGFPNGRQLTDPVITVALTLVLNAPTSDGTTGPSKPISDKFPYLADPHQAKM